MSNSLARDSRPGSSGPTRQQLDELDALLQRMLDLPVSQDEEPAEPEPPPPVRSSVSRSARQIPSPEPNLPPVRYYEPDLDFEDEDESPPPGYPPQTTMIGAQPSYNLPPVKQKKEPAREDPPDTQMLAGLEAPIPGGRHDLEEDTPVDPTEELARIRALMQQQAGLQPMGLPPTAHIPNPPQVEGGDWVPLRSSWQPSAQTWKPLVDRWEHKSEDAPAAPPMPTRHAPSGPVVVTQTVAEPAGAVSSDQSSVISDKRSSVSPPKSVAGNAEAPSAEPAHSPAAMPLVWFNAAFDLLLLAWCPRERLLRGPGGRAFLGMVGILCLLAAAALVAADRFGWPR